MNKELKKLSRRELVDIIYQLKKNEQDLQQEIESLKAEIEDKRIKVSTAGSIAEASASITDLFSTAQNTADLYLQEIEHIKRKTDKECARRLEEVNQKIDSILDEAQQKYDNLKLCYQNDYNKWQQLQQQIKLLAEQKREEL